MHINREMNVAFRLGESVQMQQAIRLAFMGNYEHACRVVEDFLEEESDLEIKIFARRETVGWRAQMGHVDEAAELANSLAEQAEQLWGVEERSLIIRNSEMYWAGKAGLDTQAERLANNLVVEVARTLRPDDELACAIRNNAARIFENGCTPERAGDIYRELLRDYSRWGLSKTTEALTTRHNYAVYLRKKEAFPESIRTFQYQLLLVSGEMGEYSEAALATRHEIALVMFLSDDIMAAREQWEAVYSDAADYLGPNHPLVLEAANYLLGCSLIQKDTAGIETWSNVLIEVVSDLQEPQLRAALVRLRNSATQNAAE